MARVVLFSYGPMIAPLRGLLTEVGATLLAVVLPSNRSGEALTTAHSAAMGAPTFTQPPAHEVEPLVENLGRLSPDLFLVWHYSMLLSADLLAIPRYGTVNVHGGILPDYRGAHVLQWAILNGEPETGVTLHYVDEGIDTGPVIAEERIAIEADDDAASVSNALEAAGLRLLRRHWSAIARGDADVVEQADGGRYWPLRTEADSAIDWRQPALRIHNLVRALVPPWTGATFRVGERRVIVDRSEVIGLSGEPGTVLELESGSMTIAAGDGAIVISSARTADGPVQFDELGLAIGECLSS